MLKILTAGESHGKALVGILEGMPAGVPVSAEDFSKMMQRRQIGYGRGPRSSIEPDQVEILSGVWRGRTIGSPIALIIWNKDQSFALLESRTSVCSSLGGSDSQPTLAELSVPLPGHADLAGALKYGFDDVRPIRERASARETAIRVALSVPPRRLLGELGVKGVSFVAELGGKPAKIPTRSTIASMQAAIERQAQFFLTPDSQVISTWKKLVDEARKRGDSLGGVVEIWFDGLPPGLGSHVDAARRLDARIAGALMGIQGVRAVEIGQGIKQSALTGRKAIDPILFSSQRGWHRRSNRAGGLEGGMTTGERLVLRVYMKPIPGPCRLPSVNFRTRQPAKPDFYRSDTCALDVLACVAESVITFELVSAFLEKFGRDTLEEIKNALEQYKKRIAF